MNLAVISASWLRKWYILLPGIALACVVAFGAWVTVPPKYERSATELLLAGERSLPDSNSNPFLFLSGLTNVADVVARAVGSQNALDEIQSKYSDTTVVVGRDGATSAPIIIIDVTGSSDAEVEVVLRELVERTPAVLDQLQQAENVQMDNRISVRTLTFDQESTIQQRTRILVTAGSGLIILVVTLFAATFLDRFASFRRAGPRISADANGSTGTVPRADDMDRKGNQSTNSGPDVQLSASMTRSEFGTSDG